MKRILINTSLIIVLTACFAPMDSAAARVEPAGPGTDKPSFSIARNMEPRPNYDKEAASTEAVTEDGNRESIHALLNKECEIAFTSRPLQKDEFKEASRRGMEIRQGLIETVGIAVAVHVDNPVNELTVEQVGKILSGECRVWSNLGGRNETISVVSNGNQEDFLRRFGHTYFKSSPARTDIEAERLADNPNGIAIIKCEKADLGPAIKLLAIKKDEQSPGLLPSEENITHAAYPFVQTTYACVDWKNSTGATKAFFNFCISKGKSDSSK